MVLFQSAPIHGGRPKSGRMICADMTASSRSAEGYSRLRVAKQELLTDIQPGPRHHRSVFPTMPLFVQGIRKLHIGQFIHQISIHAPKTGTTFGHNPVKAIIPDAPMPMDLNYSGNGTPHSMPLSSLTRAEWSQSRRTVVHPGKTGDAKPCSFTKKYSTFP